MLINTPDITEFRILRNGWNVCKVGVAIGFEVGLKRVFCLFDFLLELFLFVNLLLLLLEPVDCPLIDPTAIVRSLRPLILATPWPALPPGLATLTYIRFERANFLLLDQFLFSESFPLLGFQLCFLEAFLVEIFCMLLCLFASHGPCSINSLHGWQGLAWQSNFFLFLPVSSEAPRLCIDLGFKREAKHFCVNFVVVPFLLGQVLGRAINTQLPILLKLWLQSII